MPRPRPRLFQSVMARPERTPDPSEPASSICLEKLAGLATASALPPLEGPGGCGAPDAVRLEAVWTRAGRRVALQPAAELRCGMAEAVARWVREDVGAALNPNAAPLASLTVAASYECRGRNRVAGALLSQHGLANALDVSALRLADGTTLALTDPAVDKGFRTRLHDTACARFTTVLGPGSDGYHEQHVHLDLTERRNGYRICQWAVREPAEPPAPAAAARPAPTPPSARQASLPAAAVPMPRSAPGRVAPAPAKPLPAVRRGSQATRHLVAAPVAAPVAQPAPKRRTRAQRSASCRGQACPPRTSHPRSRTSQREAEGPIDQLRKFFRW